MDSKNIIQAYLSVIKQFFSFPLLPRQALTMSRHKNYSYHEFHLPEIKRTQQNINKSSIYSHDKNILTRFEQQLMTGSKKYQSQVKQKRKPIRLKTIDVNDHETFDDMRKELRSIKEEVNYSIKEHNHRLENKFEEFVFLSAMKKEQPQVVMQPFPIYLPPMYPPMHPSMNHMYSPPPMTNYNNDYQQNYQSYPNYPQKNRPFRKPKKLSEFSLKRFRKCVFAVLFTIRLRKFVIKVIKHKKQMFKKYLYDSNDFKDEATQIKKLFIDKLKPFLVVLLQRQDSQLNLNPGDSENFKRQKMLTTRRLIQLLIECLLKAVQSNAFQSITKSIYYFCRHGSPSPQQKLLTHQQLQNICISQKNFHIQAQKNLQKSQIINFLFMKILIYNALGQSWKIDSVKFSRQKETLQENILLLSSIFYQLMMDVQDDLIVNSPQTYKLNNYQMIKGMKIYPAESLTVKPGEYRKGEMISGLVNENVIKSVYNIDKTWTKEKNQLLEIIEYIHHKIVAYHKNLIKPFL